MVERCPTCYADSKVIETRAFGKHIYRRRRCLGCGERWTTYEVPKAALTPEAKKELGVR